jgi:hypothetical protein
VLVAAGCSLGSLGVGFSISGPPASVAISLSRPLGRSQCGQLVVPPCVGGLGCEPIFNLHPAGGVKVHIIVLPMRSVVSRVPSWNPTILSYLFFSL